MGVCLVRQFGSNNKANYKPEIKLQLPGMRRQQEQQTDASIIALVGGNRYLLCVLVGIEQKTTTMALTISEQHPRDNSLQQESPNGV